MRLPRVRKSCPRASVLDVVPADADAEAKPLAREQVDIRRLLRHQRGLPLRQHKHPGDEFQPVRAGGGEAEQHERIMERVLLGVGSIQLWFAALVRALHHMVIGHHVAIAELFGGCDKLADRARIAGDLRRRI